MLQTTEPLSGNKQTVLASARLEHTEYTEQAHQSTVGGEQRESAVTDRAGVVPRKRTVRYVGSEYHLVLLRIAQMVWLFLGIVEGMIGVRVFLTLIGANADNDFGGFVYNFAGVFLAPFFGLTGGIPSGVMVLEIPSLIAMVVYAMLGWVIVRAVLPLLERPTTFSRSTFDRSSG